MSDEKKPDMIFIKDTAVFMGWIAAILLIAGLCWALTQPVRSRFLARAVNRVLEQSGDQRRVGEVSSPGGNGVIGSWYTMSQSDAWGTRAFVFTFIGEGTFFPCAAIVDGAGKVQEFIPLNSHGEKIMTRTSPGLLRFYTRRIEGIKS